MFLWLPINITFGANFGLTIELQSYIIYMFSLMNCFAPNDKSFKGAVCRIK